MPARSRPTLALLLAPPLLLVGGCAEALGAFEQERNHLHVFTTHHATPVDGAFPDKGGEDLPRVFDNDVGWTVTLAEAYVVTANLVLEGCNQRAYPLDMYWGPCAENVSHADLDTVTVAGRELAAGNYCQIVVQYAPYDPAAPTGSDDKHPLPDAPEIIGATIFLNGFAENAGGDKVGFTLRSQETILVEKDLSTIENGGPLSIDKDNFPEEITVSKTYDRFFDGVDFNNYDQAALTAQIGQVLRQETRVSHGTIVQMP